MDEAIVVAERRAVFGEAWQGFRGYRPLEDPAARSALAGLCRAPRLARRGDVEEDESLLQPIPYVVLVRQGPAGREVYAYERLSGGGEARLHGRLSVGVGGHMNRLFDAASLGRVVAEEAAREIEEELRLEDAAGREVAAPPVRLLGLISDDADAVQRVHLGLLALAEIPPAVTVRVRETDQLAGYWADPAQLRTAGTVERLEGWAGWALGGITEGEA